MQRAYGSHTRRQFEEAQGTEPRLVDAALEQIAKLYKEEVKIRELGLEGVATRAHRGEYSKLVVDAFFAGLKQTVITEVILPTNPFGQAARYAWEREAGLRVFLANLDVPLDTNQLEREIRPVALRSRSRQSMMPLPHSGIHTPPSTGPPAAASLRRPSSCISLLVISIQTPSALGAVPQVSLSYGSVNNADRFPVTTKRSGIDAMVDDGLAPGEPVVVYPSDAVREGVRVQVRDKGARHASGS